MVLNSSRSLLHCWCEQLDQNSRSWYTSLGRFTPYSVTTKQEWYHSYNRLLVERDRCRGPMAGKADFRPSLCHKCEGAEGLRMPVYVLRGLEGYNSYSTPFREDRRAYQVRPQS